MTALRIVPPGQAAIGDIEGMKEPVELTEAGMRLVPSGILEAQIEQMASGTENEAGLWLLNGKPPPPQLAPSQLAPSPDTPPYGKWIALGSIGIAGLLTVGATELLMRRAPPAAPPPVSAATATLQSQAPASTEHSPTATQVDPAVQTKAWAAQMQTWLEKRSQSESKPTIALPVISSAVPPQHRVAIQRPRKPVEAAYHRDHLSFVARRPAEPPLPATNNCPPSVCFPWDSN